MYFFNASERILQFHFAQIFPLPSLHMDLLLWVLVCTSGVINHYFAKTYINVVILSSSTFWRQVVRDLQYNPSQVSHSLWRDGTFQANLELVNSHIANAGTLGTPSCQIWIRSLNKEYLTLLVYLILFFINFIIFLICVLNIFSQAYN